jgi:uncharacterized cupredoxin-like copper-binding protein
MEVPAVLLPAYAQRHAHISRILIAALALTASGAAQHVGSGGFGASVRTRGDSAASSTLEAARPQVASVTLSPARLTAGESTSLTIRLTQPASENGATVSLTTSDDSVVSVPAFVKVPVGEDSVTVEAYTSSNSNESKVSITAFTDSTLAGTSLEVSAATTTPFTLSLSPNTVTIVPGHSASTTVKAKASTGYSHSLKLTAANLPAGVSLSLNPSTIPAPGTGSSTADITVAGSVASGTYSIHVTASDGTHSRSATLKLKVGSSSSGPGATFNGCWYQSGGSSYQGVTVTTTNSGTFPFYANLYFGATCDPNEWADDFGNGQLLQFSPQYTWTFWFDHFPNQTAMSAQYQIGSQVSQCINYEVVPSCP